MTLRFGCGTGFQEVDVPDRNLIGWLHANAILPALTGARRILFGIRTQKYWQCLTAAPRCRSRQNDF